MGKDPGPAYKDLQQKYQHEKSQRESSSGGSGCFTADTNILTPNGWRQIGILQKGDLVISADTTNDRIITREIVRVRSFSRPARIWHIRFSGSERVLRATQTHSFLTQNGWKQTRELVAGDSIVSVVIHGVFEMRSISNVERTDTYLSSYNLVTYGQNNFIAEGTIAHNFTFCKRIRSFIANRSYELNNTANGIRRKLQRYLDNYDLKFLFREV